MAARTPLYVVVNLRPFVYGSQPAYVAARHPIGSNTPIAFGDYVGKKPYVGLKGYVARPYVVGVRNEVPALNGSSALWESQNSVNDSSDPVGRAQHRGGKPA